MDSAAQVNKKRKRDSNNRVLEHLYGIVTTGTMWAFLWFVNGNVKIHRRGGISIGQSPLLTNKQQDDLHRDIEVLFSYIPAIYNQGPGCTLKRPSPRVT